MRTNWTVFCAIAAPLVSLTALAQLPSTINLNVTPGMEVTPVLRIYGDDGGDKLGERFEFADINGDGADDIILGATQAGGSTGRPRAGELYVIYGASDLGNNLVNLNTDGAISPVGETRILGDKGESADDPKGERDFGTVTSGDVNGDGFDDIIASARLACPYGREWAGTIYVFYGSAALPGSLLNLSTDGVTSQFGETRILGRVAFDHTGVLTLVSGDFNGDGYDDMAFGTRGQSNRAYIYYGSPTLPGAVLDMNGTAGRHGETTIHGDSSGIDPLKLATWYFPSGLGAGDVNGDGVDDLILGASSADPDGRVDAGAVYVLYGGATLPGATVNILDAVTSAGSTSILGGVGGDSLGASVAAGDIDRDGIDDVIVGAPSADPAGRDAAGITYVIYGHAALPGDVLDLSNVAGMYGETRILGDDGAGDNSHHVGDKLGWLVSSADVNGDGGGDIVTGAPRAIHPVSTSVSAEGETIVVFGNADLRGMTVDLDGYGGDVRVLGSNRDVANDGMGKSSADLDVDGFADFATYMYDGKPAVFDTIPSAGGVVAIFGNGTAASATAVEKMQAGYAPLRGVGGRLSPVLRTWLSYQGGDDGTGGASFTTVTLTRSNAAIRNLGPLTDVADVVWEVNSNRAGTAAAQVVFQYLDLEIAELSEGDMQLFEAPSLSGPWTPVANQALDEERNEIGGTGTEHYFAIADLKNTCPEADAGANVTIPWDDQAVTTIPGQAFDPDPNATLIYRWLDVSNAEAEVLIDWTEAGQAGEADLNLGNMAMFPVGASVLRLELSDGVCTVFDDMTLVLSNSAPMADAGGNVMILTSAQATTALQGVVSDVDGDALTYRWLAMVDGSSTVVLSSTPAGPLGEAVLDLSQLQQLPVGQHTFRLEASDGVEAAVDDAVVTIDNAPPNTTLVGCGTYAIGVPVGVGGSASDFDGDRLDWAIEEDSEVLAIGQVQTPAGGDPVSIEVTDLSAVLGVGSHTLKMRASDGINVVLSDACVVTIVDTEVPTLAPVSSVAQLWPPNHQLIPVVIEVNARDNSGDPIVLSVSIMSDEPADAMGTGNAEPDWIVDGIEHGPGGCINLQLRAERSGKGDGRAYTITMVAEDTSGNTSSAQIRIVSPHDRGRK